ncbi:MAG: tRNA lysidine(34) synthetase TilS [Dehalococcoidales bacterium]|nr:tRNA lysidine(34) synthetase TilS [Dehalococcoidales bacterium]
MKRQGCQEPLAQRVMNYIQKHRLLSDEPHLVVAVSGGPDSVCLLHILSVLQEQLKVKLHVAHLDHQLRGLESEADARYVASLARQFSIPATIDRRDVRAYQSLRRSSPEEAAREVRYDFLAEVVKSTGADGVAAGHTTDDHIETILMHLIRGTGARGLRGLQPRSRWQSPTGSLTIVRPLLAVSREETVAYCHQYQLKPRLDTSNLSLSPLRNRIRHQLLPQLLDYNPGIAGALLRTARIAADDLAFMETETERLWDKVARRQGNTIILDREGLLALPPALQRHLLRAGIETLLGNLNDIEARHIEEIMAALTRSAGKSLNLPGGLVFSNDYNRYLLGLDPAELSPFPPLENEFSLNIPGVTEFPGWRVTASLTERGNMTDKVGRFTAFFDYEKTGGKATVRQRQPGDRFHPLGMSHPKKLGEFMIDARIPASWRPRVPVVCSPEQVLWLVGWRIDDRVKVTANTRQVLRLDFQAVSGSV